MREFLMYAAAVLLALAVLGLVAGPPEPEPRPSTACSGPGSGANSDMCAELEWGEP